MPAVWYGCETWSIILREKHILRVFEDKVLRRIYGPRIGDWRKVYNEELHDFHFLADTIIIIKPSRMR